MKRIVGTVCAALLLAAACSRASSTDAVRVGAIYPLSGSQAMDGVDEHRGALLAADLINEDGGVDGHPLEVTSVDVPNADSAPAAIDQLAADGIQLVMGSNGSTISEAAAPRTAANGQLFWETGAVGMLPETAGRGELTFRVPPTGSVLGRGAIEFVTGRLAKELQRDPDNLRYAVSYVDDVYGRTVADGALSELSDQGLRIVGRFGYDYRRFDANALARKIAAAGTDVLFVSAYLQDGIALRRALVRNHVPLVANIGSSSSYCMPEFGAALGPDAVGVFASDKPDAYELNPKGLSPEAADLLERAGHAYEERYGEEMSAPALAGFAGAWALFAEVLPRAADLSPTDVAAAARDIDLPAGSLPNGSGLRFGAPGTADAGDNLAATSVIWEWVAPGEEAVVWPPAFATQPPEALSIT